MLQKIRAEEPTLPTTKLKSLGGSSNDSAAKGQLDIYDGFFLADHCIQLLGAVDVVRAESPGPVFFGQLPPSLGDGWALGEARRMMRSFVEEMGSFAGIPVTDAALAASIALFNENRRLLRELFASDPARASRRPVAAIITTECCASRGAS